MGTKTDFSQLVATNGPLPEKCCAHCTHARPKEDVGTLKKMYLCHEGPPTPLLIGTPQGIQIHSHFPAMAAESDCDRFSPADRTAPAGRTAPADSKKNE